MRRCIPRLSLAVVAPASTTKAPAEAPKVDAVPTPSEAPHILESSSSNERKPFVSAKRLKAFTGSLVVGAVSMAAVYSLLSKSMSDRHTAEVELVDRITRSTLSAAELEQRVQQDAADLQKKFVGNFVSPSSFAELKHKANDEALLKLKPAGPAKEESLLHDVILFRAKRFWNDCITNVQTAVDQFERQYRERRRSLAVEALEQRLKEEFPDRSFTLTKL